MAKRKSSSAASGIGVESVPADFAVGGGADPNIAKVDAPVALKPYSEFDSIKNLYAYIDANPAAVIADSAWQDDVWMGIQDSTGGIVLDGLSGAELSAARRSLIKWRRESTAGFDTALAQAETAAAAIADNADLLALLDKSKADLEPLFKRFIVRLSEVRDSLSAGHYATEFLRRQAVDAQFLGLRQAYTRIDDVFGGLHGLPLRSKETDKPLLDDDGNVRYQQLRRVKARSSASSGKRGHHNPDETSGRFLYWSMTRDGQVFASTNVGASKSAPFFGGHAKGKLGQAVIGDDGAVKIIWNADMVWSGSGDLRDTIARSIAGTIAYNKDKLCAIRAGGKYGSYDMCCIQSVQRDGKYPAGNPDGDSLVNSGAIPAGEYRCLRTDMQSNIVSEVIYRPVPGPKPD